MPCRTSLYAALMITFYFSDRTTATWRKNHICAACAAIDVEYIAGQPVMESVIPLPTDSFIAVSEAVTIGEYELSFTRFLQGRRTSAGLCSPAGSECFPAAWEGWLLIVLE